MTTIWIDAHLSPAIAIWITNTFGITALALRDLGLRDASDRLLERYPDAQIWWVRIGHKGVHRFGVGHLL